MKRCNLDKHKFFYWYAKISIMIFSLLIISCGSSILNSTSLNNIPVDVYVGGSSFISSTNVPVAVYWKNGGMVVLSTESSGVKSIAVAGNDVYAGGYIMKYEPSIPDEHAAAMIAVAGYWKNGEWVGLSVLDSRNNSSVETMFMDGDDIYVGGYSANRSNIRVAGYWKNIEWVGLTSNSKYDSSVNSIFVTDNDIYACGYMRGKGIQIPVYWKNGECIELSFLSDKKAGNAYSIFVSNNDVYICGYSRNNSGVYTACYWKNSEIIPLSSSEPKDELQANSIFIAGKDVYISGYRSNRLPASGDYVPLLAGYWKNNKWMALIPFDNKKNSETSSIFVYGKDVYVGGYSENSRGDGIPGYWKNGKWVGFNVGRGHSPVSSIVVVPKL